MKETPFSEVIERTSGNSCEWMDYNGFKLAVIVDHSNINKEIAAGRKSLAVLDVTGINKHSLKGPDAAKLIDRICTREISRFAVGAVAYTLIVNEDGMIKDDATVFRLADDYFLLLSGGNHLDWIEHHKASLDVDVSLATAEWTLLSVYGPKSAAFLNAAGIKGLDILRAFRFMYTHYNGVDLIVSRTGFSGALGYELLIPMDEHTGSVLDGLMASPSAADITFVGAMASTKLGLEVGFLVPGWHFPVPGVDDDADPSEYRSPYDLNMDWVVNLDRSEFVGKQALGHIKKEGPRFNLVAVEINEKTVDEERITCARLYNAKGSRIGVIHFGAFSLALKKYIGLGTIEPGGAKIGDEVKAGDDEWAAVIRKSPLMVFPERTQTPPPGI